MKSSTSNPKCPHDNGKMTPKNNSKTPKGLFLCTKCKCLWRVCGSGKRTYLALVTRDTDCYNKEHPELAKVMKIEKKKVKPKKKVEKEEEE